LGYYGRGNPGDEALMEAAVRVVADAGAIPVVATDSPSSLPPGVEAVPRTSLLGLKVLRAISGCEAVLFGGGGIFQDSTSLRSLLFYAKLALAAKAKGKALLLVAQGVGPLRRGISRRIVRRVFESADLADVRDERSRRLLEEVGVEASKVTVSTDLSFLLAEEARGLVGGRRQGMALFPRLVKGVKALEEVAKGAAIASSRLGLPLRLVPFQRGVDERAVELMSPLAKGARPLPPPSDWREAAREVASSELAVCMRLHALAFSAMTKTPAVAIPYDPKVEALSDLLGVPRTGPLERVTKEEVCKAIEEGWERRKELSERMGAASLSLEEKAKEVAERVAKFLREGRG